MRYLRWRGPSTIARSALALLAVGVGAVVAGCVITPFTGQQVTDPTSGYRMGFTGRTDTKPSTIKAFVLANAGDDPLTGIYSQIGSTSTLSGPYNGGDSVPYYNWTIASSASTPLNTTQWPAGGLARFRVKSKYNGNSTEKDLATFTNEGIDCLLDEASSPWRSAGVDCHSQYVDSAIITVVSTTPTPAETQDSVIPYLGYGANHQNGSPIPFDHEEETTNYYDNIDAPVSLGDFIQKYAFPTGETRAIYYNNGDLGIARDMHCKKFTPPGKLAVTACYVSNYGRNAGLNPEFGNVDPQEAIAQAINGTVAPTKNQVIATVAMVYDPSFPVDANRVQFMVFGTTGGRTEYAPLDNQGLNAIDVHAATNANINVPDNCLACHGASSNYSASKVGAATIKEAYFLPFDPEAFVFSTSSATYSETNMAPRLKTLNGLVWDTAPQQAIIDLLKGMYPVNGVPTGPKDPASAFSNTYVPAGWVSAGQPGIEIYNEVVKPYCRSCHVGAKASKDWDSFLEFKNDLSLADDVCSDSGPMPQAEQAQTRFWKSPARAHLANAFNIGGGCAP